MIYNAIKLIRTFVKTIVHKAINKAYAGRYGLSSTVMPFGLCKNRAIPDMAIGSKDHVKNVIQAK